MTSTKTHRPARNRLNAVAMRGAEIQADALRMKAAGHSHGEIAKKYGYRDPSGSKMAIRRGIERSNYRKCLLAVCRKRILLLDDWLLSLEDSIDPADAEAYEELLEQFHSLIIEVEDVIDGDLCPAGIQDMERRLRLRNPQPFVEDVAERDRLIGLRAVDGRLVDLLKDAGVRTRSGAYKKLDRTVRRSLLAAADAYYEGATDAFWYWWHLLEKNRRRVKPDLRLVRGALLVIEHKLRVVEALPRSPRKMASSRRADRYKHRWS